MTNFQIRPKGRSARVMCLNELKKQFSCNLVYYMVSDSISCGELCKEIDVSPQTLTYWRTGKRLPSILHLKDLANHFRVSMESMIEPLRV